MGPETGLEMRLQQRSKDHLKDGAKTAETGPREGQKGQNVRSVDGALGAHREEGSLQGRLHKVLNSVAARSEMRKRKKKFPVKSNFETSSFIAGINSDILTCLLRESHSS